MVNPFRQELQNREGGGSSNPFRRELERREMPTARSAPEQPRMRRTPERTGPGESDLGFIEFAGESLKAAGSIASSGITEVAAGLGGIGGLMYGAISGNTSPIEQAVRNIETVREFAYVPEEGMSRRALEAMGGPFARLEEGAQRAGGATTDVLGPEAGTAVYTALSFLPDLAAGPISRSGRRGARVAARRAEERELRRQGIDPAGRRDEQARQIAEAGREMEGGRVRGEGMEGVAETAQRLYTQMKEVEDNAWNTLRETGAWVDPQSLRGLQEPVSEISQGFPLDDMPRLRGRINRLNELINRGDEVPLSDLVNYRKTLNRASTPSDPAQSTGIVQLKGVLDRYLKNDFNTAAISGDPQALQRWSEALEASTDLNTVFPRNSLVRNLAEREATPEEMRKWLFGTNSILGKNQTMEFLDQIRGIVGENSPQFNAIRKDGLLDLLEPLTQSEPNIGQFIRNYDRMIRRNNTVSRELYGDSLESLERLRNAAVSARRAADKERGRFQIEDNAIRALFGHELSAGQARMNFFRGVFQQLKNIREPSRRRRFMAEMMGYDAFDPVLPKGITTIEGAREAGEATQEDTEEEGQQR